MAMTKRCKNCGQQIPFGAKNCPNCGAQQSSFPIGCIIALAIAAALPVIFLAIIFFAAFISVIFGNSKSSETTSLPDSSIVIQTEPETEEITTEETTEEPTEETTEELTEATTEPETEATTEAPVETTEEVTEKQTEKATSASDSSESILVLLNYAGKQGFGDNYKIDYDKDSNIYTMSVWMDGIAAAATLYGNSEDWQKMTESMRGTCETMTDNIRQFDPDAHMCIAVLNDINKENVLLTILDGVIIYDVTKG